MKHRAPQPFPLFLADICPFTLTRQTLSSPSASARTSRQGQAVPGPEVFPGFQVSPPGCGSWTLLSEALGVPPSAVMANL